MIISRSMSKEKNNLKNTEHDPLTEKEKKKLGTCIRIHAIAD